MSLVIFEYVFATLDPIIGHRPDFVIPNFYEFWTQTLYLSIYIYIYIYTYMSISGFLCANDVYLHFIHVWFFIC